MILSISNSLLFTVGSYIVGHFISYLSSVTVEKFAIWQYGYPSQYLLDGRKHKYYIHHDEKYLQKIKNKKYFDNDFGFILSCITRENIGKCLLAFFLFPLNISCVILGRICNLQQLYIKPLDLSLIETIKLKNSLLRKHLKFKEENDSKDDDYHRTISHYEYKNDPAHAIKMNNYIALYGFMRAFTLIFNFLLLVLLYSFGVEYYHSKEINMPFISLIISVMLIEYVFFMGFMKFYRRFTLESFMCLVIDNSYCEDYKVGSKD